MFDTTTVPTTSRSLERKDARHVARHGRIGAELGRVLVGTRTNYLKDTGYCGEQFNLLRSTRPSNGT